MMTKIKNTIHLMKNYWFTLLVPFAFLSLTVFKINIAFSNVLSFQEVYLLIFGLTFFFSSILTWLGKWLMSFTLFQYILLYFLRIKDMFYGFIDKLLWVFNQLGPVGLFVSSFSCSGMFFQLVWWLFSKILVPFHIPIFIPMFLFSILNLIEHLLLFNETHIHDILAQKEEFSFQQALFFLGLKPAKNLLIHQKETFPFIQKRYVSWSSQMTPYFKYVFPVGTVFGFGITTYFTYKESVFHEKTFQYQQQKDMEEHLFKERQFQYQQQKDMEEHHWKQHFQKIEFEIQKQHLEMQQQKDIADLNWRKTQLEMQQQKDIADQNWRKTQLEMQTQQLEIQKQQLEIQKQQS
jgi:hypothetical protein